MRTFLLRSLSLFLIATAGVFAAPAKTTPQPQANPPESAKATTPAQKPKNEGDWIVDASTGCKVWNSGPQPGETVSWSGPCENGIANGEGTLVYFVDGKESCRTNAQLMKNGRRSGYAKMVCTGSHYAGEWENGVFHGKGSGITVEGTRFEGDFVNGKMSGKGVEIWPNGDKYEGDFVNGARTGKAVFTWKDGDRYEGDFIDSKKTGKGKMTGYTGNVYEGDFVDSKFHGKGTFTWKDGAKYEGDFIDNKRTGKGMLTFPDGNVYTGDFVDGQQSGKGTFAWKDGSKYDGDVYKGDFINNKKTGKGTYTWKNGGSYEGDVVDGMLHGKGILVRANGDRYEGEFINGKISGAGIFTKSADVAQSDYFKKNFAISVSNADSSMKTNGQSGFISTAKGSCKDIVRNVEFSAISQDTAGQQISLDVDFVLTPVYDPKQSQEGTTISYANPVVSEKIVLNKDNGYKKAVKVSYPCLSFYTRYVYVNVTDFVLKSYEFAVEVKRISR